MINASLISDFYYDYLMATMMIWQIAASVMSFLIPLLILYKNKYIILISIQSLLFVCVS